MLTNTDGTSRSTIIPSTCRCGDKFELDLIPCYNRTADEYPLGV